MKIFINIIVILTLVFISGLCLLPANAGKSYFSLKDKSIIFEVGSVADTVIIDTKKIKNHKAKGIKPQPEKIFNSADLPSVKMFLSPFPFPFVKSPKKLKIVFLFLMEKGKSRLEGKIGNVKLRIKKNGSAKIIVPQDTGIERSVTYKFKSPSLRAKGIREIHGHLTNDPQGPLITDGAGLLKFATKVFKDKIVESVNNFYTISDPQLSGTFDLSISIKGTKFAIETEGENFKKVNIFKGKIKVQ